MRADHPAPVSPAPGRVPAPCRSAAQFASRGRGRCLRAGQGVGWTRFHGCIPYAAIPHGRCFGLSIPRPAGIPPRCLSRPGSYDLFFASPMHTPGSVAGCNVLTSSGEKHILIACLSIEACWARRLSFPAGHCSAALCRLAADQAAAGQAGAEQDKRGRLKNSCKRHVVNRHIVQGAGKILPAVEGGS